MNTSNTDSLTDDQLIELGRQRPSGMPPWGIGSARSNYLRAVRAAIEADRSARAGVPEVSEAMVEAYLTANDAYWSKQDTILSRPTKWRSGTPSEATLVSLQAALLAATPPVQSAAAVAITDRQIEDAWLAEHGRLPLAGDVRAVRRVLALAAAPAPADAGEQAEPVAEERDWSDRYRVTRGGLHYCVRAGTGARGLFFGSKNDCDQVAHELLTAFRDGQSVAATAPAAQVAKEPLTEAQRCEAFCRAEKVLMVNPNKSWRDAIADEVERAYGIGTKEQAK